MKHTPTADELRSLPKIGSHSGESLDDLVVHMHFTAPGCHWFMSEYDPNHKIFWGYAILDGDLKTSDWGEDHLDDLRSYRSPEGYEIERDIHWTPRKAAQVEEIKEAYRARGR